MNRWHNETDLMRRRWREELKNHGYALDLSLLNPPPPGVPHGADAPARSRGWLTLFARHRFDAKEAATRTPQPRQMSVL